MAEIKSEAVILRGISGSGKSSLKKVLEEMCAEAGLTVAMHSTDDYHMVDGEYIFDPKKLGYFHRLNKEAFEKSLADGVDIVVCDNTNLRQREYSGYIKAARDLNSIVVAVVFYPDDYDKHVERNKHGVPEDVILRMMGTLGNNINTVGVDEEFVMIPENFCDKNLRSISNQIIDKLKHSKKDAI